MSLFLLPGSEHAVGREFFICEDAAFVIPVCPRLVFGNAVKRFKINKELYGHPDAVSDIHFFVNFDISNWLYLSQN